MRFSVCAKMIKDWIKTFSKLAIQPSWGGHYSQLLFGLLLRKFTLHYMMPFLIDGSPVRDFIGMGLKLLSLNQGYIINLLIIHCASKAGYWIFLPSSMCVCVSVCLSVWATIEKLLLTNRCNLVECVMETIKVSIMLQGFMETARKVYA